MIINEIGASARAKSGLCRLETVIFADAVCEITAAPSQPLQTAVMLVAYVPGVMLVNLHDSDGVPPEDRITLDGHSPARPEGVETVRVRFPLRPERLVKVTGLFPLEPGGNATFVAEMLKSITVIEKEAEWVTEPPVPVTVPV